MQADADYRAFGKFSPVYDHALDELLDESNRPAYHVLKACAYHCSETGMFFAGIRALAAVSRYSYGTVKREFWYLVEKGWIRQHIYYDPIRRRQTKTWQLSPYIFWVASPFIDEALDLWGKAEVPLFNVRCNAQPDNQNQNQIQNHNQNPESDPELEPPPPVRKTHSDLSGDSRPPSDYTNQRFGEGRDVTPEPDRDEPPNHAEQRRKSDTARQRKKQRDHADKDESGFRRDLSRFSKPLSDPDAERIALRLSAVGNGTRITQARDLVDRHGVEKCSVAIAWTEHVTANGDDTGRTVRNPVGYLVANLERGGFDGLDKPQDDSKRFTSGKYAEFIQS